MMKNIFAAKRWSARLVCTVEGFAVLFQLLAWSVRFTFAYALSRVSASIDSRKIESLLKSEIMMLKRIFAVIFCSLLDRIVLGGLWNLAFSPGEGKIYLIMKTFQITSFSKRKMCPTTITSVARSMHPENIVSSVLDKVIAWRFAIVRRFSSRRRRAATTVIDRCSAAWIRTLSLMFVVRAIMRRLTSVTPGSIRIRISSQHPAAKVWFKETFTKSSAHILSPLASASKVSGKLNGNSPICYL